MNMVLAKNLCIFLYIMFLTSTVSNAGLSISLGLLGVSLIYIYIREKKKIIWPDTKFLIIYVIFFGSLFLAAGIRGDITSLNETRKYMYWTLPFWCMYLAEKESFSSVSWGCGASISLLGMGVYSIYQFVMLPLGTRITGTFVSANGLAGVLETSLPMAIAFFWVYTERRNKTAYDTYGQYILLGIIGITIFLLLATQSRGGIAGAFLGGSVVFLVRNRHKLCLLRGKLKYVIGVCILVCMVSIVSFLGLSTFHRSYDNERLLMIQSSYTMWKDHPFCGVGFSHWQEQYHNKYVSPMAKEPNVPMPHNNIAFFFSATGIIGGIGYSIFTIGLLIILLKKIVKNPHNVYYQAALWSFIAISVHGLVDSGITNKYNLQILFACLGIAFASENENKQPIEENNNENIIIN